MPPKHDPAKTSRELLESIKNMERVVAIQAPLKAAQSAAESVMKGLDAAGTLLNGVPIWGGTAKMVCAGISKLIKLALGATANQEVCLYLSNRVFLLHVSSLKIFAKYTDCDEAHPPPPEIMTLLGEMKKVVDEAQKLLEPYTPRLDEQENSKLGNAKKFAQFLSKVYKNVFDSMDREKFEEINTKIDRINSSATLLMVVENNNNNNNEKIPSLSNDAVKTLWKKSEQEITAQVTKAVKEGNEEIKLLLGEVTSRIEGVSKQVDDVQQQMNAAFKILLQNKDFEDYKWRGDVSRLIIDKSTVLGRGGSGIVYAATDKNEKFAAKLLFATQDEGDNAENNGTTAARSILRECRRLTEARQFGVVQTFGLVVQNPDTFLLQERCVCTLEELIRSLGRDLLPHHVRVYYLLKLASTYAQLHENLHFVMGDIKQANVLINSNGKCLVADFGSVKSVSTVTSAGGKSDKILSNLGVTPAYSAPELVESKVTTFQSDVYAFGCLIFETITGKQFYKQHSALTLEETIADAQIRRLIRRCLATNPAERPRMGEVEIIFESIMDGIQNQPQKKSAGVASVDDSTLHEVIHIFKKKAASPDAFDPNSAPASPTSNRLSSTSSAFLTGAGGSAFPYWMAHLGISDEAKRTLIDNEFDTIQTLLTLQTESDFDAKHLESIPGGARLKIIQEIPKIAPFVFVFDEINPQLEKEYINLVAEEQVAWKSMHESLELSLAVELFQRSAIRAYGDIIAEYDSDVAALSEHLDRVSALSPLLAKKIALVAQFKQSQSQVQIKLNAMKVSFNAETEKEVAARNTNDELKQKLQHFRKTLEAKIIETCPAGSVAIINNNNNNNNNKNGAIADAKKQLTSKIEEQSASILGELAKKFADCETTFTKAKNEAETMKIVKFIMSETDVGWQRDEHAPTCNKCQESFGLFNRKHHCRVDGLVYCGKCSDFKVSTSADPSRTSSSPAVEDVRCCELCFNKVTVTQKMIETLPNLEKNFKESQQKLNSAKENLASMEKALVDLDALAKDLAAKEDEIRDSQMLSKNHHIFDEYFAVEEEFNSVTSKIQSLEIEIAALNILLDPLQKIPETFTVVGTANKLVLINPKRAHIVALVDVADDTERNQFLQFKSQDELFDNSASIQLSMEIPLLTKRKAEQKSATAANQIPVVQGISPSILAAVVGSVGFFTSASSRALLLASKTKTEKDLILAETADHRPAAYFASMFAQVDLVRFFIEHGLSNKSCSDSGVNPIHAMASCGSVQGVKLLVEAGFDKDAATQPTGYQPVMLACFMNMAGVINYLVNVAGCDVGRTKSRNTSPLHCACMANSVESIKILLASGKSNKNEVQDDGISPLIFACQNGYLEIVKLLCAVHADVTLRSSKGYDAFHAACHYGMLEVVRFFLDNFSSDELDFSAAINVAPKFTPFLSACKEGHLEIAKLLIKSGKIDKNAVDDSGRNAIGRCCITKKPEMIRYLISEGVDPEQKYTDDKEFRPIHSAAFASDLETLRALLETPIPPSATGRKKAGINVDARTKAHTTALQLAVKVGTPEQPEIALDICRYLIEERNADKDCVNQFNYGLLLACAEAGNVPLFQYLVEVQKLNINCASAAGTTVLIAAAIDGHESILDYVLTNHTVNKEATNKTGNTALSLAAIGRKPGCVRKLLEYGCNVDHKNDKGFTPFLNCCHNGDFESVKHLCAANCDQLVKSKLGNGALHLACLCEDENYKDEAAKILQFLISDKSGLAKSAHFRTAAAITEPGESKRVPLSFAAERGNVEALKILLTIRGVKVDVNNVGASDKGTSPLTFLSANATPRAEEGIRLLVAHGAKLEVVDTTGLTPLLQACKCNSLPVVKLLLSSSANIKAVGKSNWQAIHYAASSNKADILKYLLQSIKGFDCNAKTEIGQNILDLAIIDNAVDVINYILDAAADEYIKFDFEARDNEGRNCLHVALWPKGVKATLDVVKLLMTHDATVQASWRTNFSQSAIEKTKQLPLHLAAEGAASRHDIFDYVCELTPAGQHDIPDSRGATPLFNAIVGGSLTALTRLHEEYKCKIDCISSATGNSSLLVAAVFPLFSLPLTKYLIEHGADKMYLHPKTGVNCLLEAVRGNNVQTVEYLLKQPGISITFKDAQFFGVLYHAALINSPKMVQFLLGCACVELNAASGNEQQTPLHAAAYLGHTEVVKLLVAGGCNKNAQNKFGKTPFDLANDQKKPETAVACKP